MRKARIILLLLTTFSLGITYSIFQSGAHIKIEDQKIAKFLFDAELTDDIELELTDMLPGDENEYQFSVTNTNENIKTDISVEYQISISTYHFIPLTIKLYYLKDEENLVLECDESFSRNEKNELVCNMDIMTLLYDEEEDKHNYLLKISFPNEYNDEVFSSLVDFIKVDIKSWQIIEG